MIAPSGSSSPMLAHAGSRATLFVRPEKGLARRVWDSRISYAFIFPSLILVLTFMYWPTFSGIFYAFTDWQPGLERLNFVGLDNFTAMLTDEYLKTSFVNVGIIVSTTVIKDLTVPLIVAVPAAVPAVKVAV